MPALPLPLNSDEENSNNLQFAKQQIIDRIIEVTASPNPNYDIDGQKVSWADYLKTLRESLKALNELIASEDPFQVESFLDP